MHAASLTIGEDLGNEEWVAHSATCTLESCGALKNTDSNP
jgi:hypothetical protein